MLLLAPDFCLVQRTQRWPSNLIGLGYSRRSAFWQRTVLTVRRGVCRLG